MIGVDIIDLCYPIKPQHSLEDYKKKVLNNFEYAFCQNQLELYCIWAIKESTYKCYYKNGGASFLNPKKILLTLVNFETGKFITHVEGNTYYGKLMVEEKYVYAICSAQDADTIPKDIYIGKNHPSMNLRDEWAFFFKNAYLKARYQFHPDGFPLGIEVGHKLYTYSRSHHGDYYISVIGPGRDN